MAFFKKKDKNADDKEKKKKLPLSRVWENNLFALRLFWKIAPGYTIWYFTQSIIFSTTNFLSGAFLLRLIVNTIQQGKSPGGLIAFILSLAAVSAICNLLNRYMWNIRFYDADLRIQAAIQKQMFAKAQRVELNCYEQPEFYDKYVHAMENAVEHMWNVLNTVDSLVWRVTSLFGNAILIFTIDPLLILFALIPFLFGFVRKRSNQLKHDYTAANKPYDRRKAYIRRTFYLGEYAKEMRQTNMYSRLLDDFRENMQLYYRNLRHYGWRRAVLDLITKLGTEVLTILGATLYTVWRAVAQGTLLLGDCLVVLASIGDIANSLSDFVAKLAEFHEHALYIDDMRTFLAHEDAIPENEDGDIPAGGELSLEHVSFRYEGAETNALTDVSLTIRLGERIALVGQNGSGKTTLIKLLLHLYAPSEGKITLDGRDYRDFNLTGWRQQFSTVFQDYHCFSLRVAENVLLRPSADAAADRAVVEEALKNSGAWEKVCSLEHGMDTTLTREFDDHGAVLSGGESQKISLARVFAEPDRPFVLLDEPSSALDPIAEHAMFENMMRATAGRSVVFISHRLSSAVTADRIYMMEKGRIVEAGTHAELLKRNGKYAEMFHRQAANYVGDMHAVC